MSSRSYLFVLLAFGAGWLLIAVWVLQIGTKMKRLSRRIDDDLASRGDDGGTREGSEGH